MELIPAGMEKVADSSPLTIDKAKAAEMLAKAKELHTKIMDSGELMKLLEQYYVFEKNEHYTSDQLKGIVAALHLELNPPKIVEPVEKVPVIE